MIPSSRLRLAMRSGTQYFRASSIACLSSAALLAGLKSTKHGHEEWRFAPTHVGSWSLDNLSCLWPFFVENFVGNSYQKSGEFDEVPDKVSDAGQLRRLFGIVLFRAQHGVLF